MRLSGAALPRVGIGVAFLHYQFSEGTGDADYEAPNYQAESLVGGRPRYLARELL